MRYGAYLGDNPKIAARGALPTGFIAQAATGSTQSGIGTSATNLTDLDVAFTAVADHRYRIDAAVNWQKNTTAGLVYIELYQDGWGIVNTGIASHSAGEYGTTTVFGTRVPGAGSWTFRVRARASAGTLGVNPLGSSDVISWLIVTDV